MSGATVDGSYDFIVVGAGSAGSVVAHRLTEHPDVRVLVLEAGGDEIPPNVHVPAAWPTLWHTPVDWDYRTIPQPGLGGRQIAEPRGKMPGGSSNLYIMMHTRGHRSDYDNWAYSGCPGWGYDDVLPYFQRMEDQEDDTNPTAGKGGPIHVANAKLHGPNPTSATFIEACLELGYPSTDDFNGPYMEGAGWHHINIKDGRRHGAWAGYLAPILDRPNLILQTGAQATRLLFDGNRCIGVEYVANGQTHTAHTSAEVIVCGGAIESPKLLLLSGIGNPTHLAEHGITTRIALPGVGENFHNHVLTFVYQEAAQPVPPPNQNLSESALFCKSDSGWTGPDLQIGFVHVSPEYPNAMTILPGLVRPMSRGWIRLASSDPLAHPQVHPNYLGAVADLERMVQAVKLARDIFATAAFSSWAKQELLPGPDVQTDADLRTFLRNRADSYFHEVGSCRMGSDELAVVDPQLRVYGIEGLRVADASVMPTVPSANCHAGILMIGERVAELIKTAQRLVS
ncbi:MAG: GMC family oxidoreductase [Egibacteraceae bacterium]